MSDLISREAAIDALDAICERECEYPKPQRDVMCGACRLGSAFDVVDDLPSAQPEIIVCADCKHWVCHDRRCGYWNHGVKKLDWCSYAERREK